MMETLDISRKRSFSVAPAISRFYESDVWRSPCITAQWATKNRPMCQKQISKHSRATTRFHHTGDHYWTSPQSSGPNYPGFAHPCLKFDLDCGKHTSHASIQLFDTQLRWSSDSRCFHRSGTCMDDESSQNCKSMHHHHRAR